MTDDDIERIDLNQAERDVLAADGERWKKMGAGGHLQDWLAYYDGQSIRRRLAMKLAFTNRPKGKGYVMKLGELMRADGFDTNDKTLMSHMSAVLWIRDDPERERELRDILDAMTPGERSRLNTPIAARQRIVAEPARRAGGTEEKSKTSPVSILKRQNDEQARKIADLQERLAAAENDTSLFDLRNDTTAAIVKVMTDPSVISEHKATTVAKGILAAFKARTKPAG